MRISIRKIGFFGALLLITRLSFGQGSCEPTLCEIKKQQIDKICSAQTDCGMLIYLVDPGGRSCYCPCECAGNGIQKGFFSSSSTAVGGKKILAMQEKGKWQTATELNGGATQIKNATYAILLNLSDGKRFISAPYNLFLTVDRKFKRADRLAPTDILLDVKYQPVKITRILAGHFDGYVNSVPAGYLSTNDDIDHTVNINGLLCGDIHVQQQYDQDRDQLMLPEVGTETYNRIYEKQLYSHGNFLTPAHQIKFNELERFVPFEKISVPLNAVNYLPESFQKSKPGYLKPLADNVSNAVAKYLELNYKQHFPDVEYHVAWEKEDVNAKAWVDDKNVRHVLLYGGLLRHQYIGVEGAGLVLAHELGHHYGGNPSYSGSAWDAACEGQADYWGALVCQRTVWWGDLALQQIEKGSDQLYRLFSDGLEAGDITKIPDIPNNSCGHPAADCRLKTYRTCIGLGQKPSCAGENP